MTEDRLHRYAFLGIVLFDRLLAQQVLLSLVEIDILQQAGEILSLDYGSFLLISRLAGYRAVVKGDRLEGLVIVKMFGSKFTRPGHPGIGRAPLHGGRLRF